MTDYAAWDAINWSLLKYMHESPLLFRYRQRHPEPSKPHFVVGGAFHCAALEPEKMRGRYVSYEGRRDKRTKDYQAFLSEHGGKIVLKPSEWNTAANMADAVHGHRIARDLLEGGRVEAPQRWVEPLTGVAAKGCLDYIKPSAFVDLKGTTNIAHRKFASDAAKYLYHGQLAWYDDGAKEARLLPRDVQPPFLVCCEWEPPHDVAVYQMNLTDMAAGRALYLDLLTRMLACAELDSWPGKVPQLEQLQLPAFAPGLRPEDY